MTVDTAFRVFVESNPVPDPALLNEDVERDVLLAATLQRSTEMQTKEPIAAEPKQPRPRRSLILAMATIAIAVIVGLVVFLPGDEPEPDDPVAPPVTVTVTVTTVAATTPEAIEEPDTPTTQSPGEVTQATNAETLVAMIATRNSGDFEAWDAYLADDAAIWGNDPGSREWVEWQRSVMAANEQWTVVGECVWPTSFRANCHMTLINDFMEPAGLFYDTPNVIIEFNSAGEITNIVANSWNIADDPEPGYWVVFDTWFAATYPEVYDTLGPTVENQDGLPNAEAMPTALQYVEEFLAQSDIYPLDS